MSDEKKPVIFEIAPQERLRFVARLEDIFLEEVIGHSAFITDMSRITDFAPSNDIDRKHIALEGGKCVFTLTRIKNVDGIKQREAVEFTSYPEHFRIDILRKTEEVFDVDIADVYHQPIVEVLHYILVNMPEKTRLELAID